METSNKRTLSDMEPDDSKLEFSKPKVQKLSEMMKEVSKTILQSHSNNINCTMSSTFIFEDMSKEDFKQITFESDKLQTQDLKETQNF
eukprot:gene10630-3253_t